MVKNIIAICVAILVVSSVFLISYGGYTRVESAGFDAQMKRWCPKIGDYSLEQKGDTLFVKLVANEDLNPGTATQSMRLILLFFATFQEKQYADLANREI